MSDTAPSSPTTEAGGWEMNTPDDTAIVFLEDYAGRLPLDVYEDLQADIAQLVKDEREWVQQARDEGRQEADQHDCGAGRAVQDDGLDVETLRRALNDYDAFVAFREDDGRDVTLKDRHDWAERWVARLRTASPLNASGDERP